MPGFRIVRSISAALGFSLFFALSAHATNDVLILADNPTAAATSRENTAVTSLGMTSEIVNNTQWPTKIYGDYRAVVLSHNSCNGLSSLTASVANAIGVTGWSNKVTGNVVIIGTDPAFSSHTDGAQLLKSAINFAASGGKTNSGGKTGAVIIQNCQYSAALAFTPVPVLAGFESSVGNCTGVNAGKFRVQATNKEEVHIIASHPALAGLTNAQLDNWGNSSHNGFQCWPTGFTPLAVVADASLSSALRFWDGADIETHAAVKGFPYILARGVTPEPIIPPKPIDCCTPIDKSTFKSMLSEVSTGGIMAPYIVRFQTTGSINLQMQRYYDYISAVDPTIASASLYLWILDCNENTNPNTTGCSSPLPVTGGVKQLKWDTASFTSTLPWRSEWTLSGTTWTNSCPPGTNCIAWSDIFAASQSSNVNNRYRIYAATIIDRTNGDRELLWKCGILAHDVNHMQSLKMAQSSTNSLSAQELQRSEAGRRFLRDLDGLMKAPRASGGKERPPVQKEKPPVQQKLN